MRIRKTTALIATTGLALGLLPAGMAFAAPTAPNSVLTAGKDVLPGAGRQFSIDVSAGGNSLLGATSINSVLITLPSAAGLATTATGLTAPAGWNVRRTSSGTLQTYLFSDADGASSAAGTIAPGQTLRFSFPANVAAPADGDVPGVFKVSVSDDGGATASAAGTPANLTATVRVLEIVDAGRATAPAGAADGSGTAGQRITYRTQVKNHARNPLVVTPTLTSSDADTVTPPAASSVASNATHLFDFAVKLFDGVSTEYAGVGNTGSGGDRTPMFTAGATAAKAAAQTATSTYNVEAPVVLSLQSTTFDPKFARRGPSYSFTVRADKQGTPAVAAGKLTGSVTCGPVSTALVSPTSLPRGSAADQTLTFSTFTVGTTAADGDYDCAFTLDTVDANDFKKTQVTNFTKLFTIDNLAPKVTLEVTLPTDAHRGKEQTAAKNGDTITVKGTVDDAKATLDFVELRASDGQSIPVSVSRAADGKSFSGTAKPTFTAAAGTFKAEAQFTDSAGNPGTTSTASKVIDNVKPKFTYAQTEKTTEILVRFTENNGLVAGGCAPTQWKIDSTRQGDQPVVVEVKHTDGSICEAGKEGRDNDRILVLNTAIGGDRDQDYVTNVTYTPGSRPLADPVKDGAQSDAASDTVKTAIGIAPAAPQIVKVLRNGGAETAVYDENTYWTRSGDAQVEILGGRAGYTVEVLDASGKVLATRNLAGSGTVLVPVPIGDLDGVYLRKVCLVNTAGLRSDATAFSVTLDRVAPKISQADLGVDNRTITVTFSEKLAAGTDNAFDWFGFERNDRQDPSVAGDERFYYPAAKVERPSAIANSRTVTTQEQLGVANTFGGADYFLQSTNGKRYEDRAGNPLGDTTTF